MIVLDTNVLSELMKAEPDATVFGWVHSQPADQFFTTAINQAEVLFGLAVMSPGRKRELLRAGAIRMFELEFRGRILPFDGEAADSYAGVVARRQRAGLSVDRFDAAIAAIAARRGMVVATRNVSHFEDCGIEVVNPWNR